MSIRMFILAGLATVALGCGERAEPAPSDWMMDHADVYLNDAQWRRSELEASLWMPELPYARERLTGYSQGDRGWDLLPLINTQITTVGPAPRTIQLLANDEVPTTREAWLELGEQVFWQMPMRRDAYLEWLIERPELWDELGMQRTSDGTLQGIVRFTDARGTQRAGATCGLCHADGGLAGRATRDLDLGLGRDMYSQAVLGRSTEFDTWGPGRVDVTDDFVNDPLAIPDLWGVRHQTHMNHSGAIKLDTPASLAIRFETQFVVGHSLEARPDRRLSWALMMYVYSLEPAANVAPANDRGKELFEQRCASCHRQELGYSGGLVPVDMLSSDPQAAHSPLRGTGSYRALSLIRVAEGAPYLHDASAASLEELLMRHPTASDLAPADVNDLIGYLETL